LMVAVTPLDGSKDAVTKLLYSLYKNGLVGFSCGRDPYRLRFLIPAIVESKDIELAGKIIEKSVLEMA
jgi:4-aminobutyrate aminotransferase-like enzyme